MPIAQTPNQILFENDIMIKLDTMSCEINSAKFGRGIPNSLIYLDGDRVVNKKLPKANLPYSVVLVKREREYMCVLADNDLAESLLLRLYYFHGQGLKYLKPFSYDTNLTRRTEIMVYEVDWQKFLADLEQPTAL